MNLFRYHMTPQYSPASHPNLLQEIDRLFDTAFPTAGSSLRGGQFPVDLYQSKDAFSVRAELPGFRKEDLSLDVADGVLTITGHQKGEQSDATTQPNTAPELLISRGIKLSENVATDKIQAAYENGVLTVTLPKRDEVKPRQISIEVK